MLAGLRAGTGAYLDIYQAQFKNAIALQLQYRAQLVIWLLFSVLEPLVYLVVWSTVAASSGGVVAGYTAPQFAAYYIVLVVVNHVVFTWIMFEFEFGVRNGQLSTHLLRPVHPIHNYVAYNVSYKLLTLVVMLPAVIVLTLLFHPELHSPPWAVAAFVPALILAFALRFLTEWTVALAAFWTTRVAAINDLYGTASIFLSGWVAPLALFPAPIRAVANVLPFRWGLSFPVEVLLGRLTPQEVLAGMAIQIAWVVAAFVIARMAWAAGMRQFTAVGA
jgi:ABC-2 type transport system permease protein